MMRPGRESSWKVFVSNIGGDQEGENRSAHGFLVSICQNVSPTRDFPFQPLDKYKGKKSSGKAKRNSFRGRKKMLRNVCRPIIRMFAAIFFNRGPRHYEVIQVSKDHSTAFEKATRGEKCHTPCFEIPLGPSLTKCFPGCGILSLFLFFPATFPPHF